MSSLKADLISVRELIADKTKWCRGAYGHLPNGVVADDKDAAEGRCVDHCLVGAMIRVGGLQSLSLAHLFVAMRIETGFDALSDFNDNTSHSVVLAALDGAIRRAS